jgi:hypothetical protein
MFKKQNFFLLFAVICSYSFSQTIELKWGPEMDLGKNRTIGNIIGVDSTGFLYTLADIKASSADITHFQKTGFDFKHLFTKDIYVGGTKKLYVNSIKTVKDGVLLFLSEKNEKNENIFYVQPLDLNGNMTGALSEIQTISEEDMKTFYHYAAVSPDSQRVVRIYEDRRWAKIHFAGTDPAKRRGTNENKQMFVSSLDNKGKILWKKQIIFPNKTINMVDVNRVCVANNGDIFIVAKEFFTPERVDFKYTIFKISNEGETVQEFGVPSSATIYSIFIKTLENGNLACVGTYRRKEEEGAQGLFSFQMNEENKIIKYDSKDFPIEFIKSFFSKDNIKEKEIADFSLFNFRINDILFKSDGNAVAVGELFSQGDGTNFHDIYIIDISEDGKINFIKRIPNYQMSFLSTAHCSFSYSMYKDKLYVFFNNTYEGFNEHKYGGLLRLDVSKFNYTMCIVDGDKISKQQIFDSKELKIIVGIQKSYWLNDHTLILCAAKPTTSGYVYQRLGILTIKE